MRIKQINKPKNKIFLAVVDDDDKVLIKIETKKLLNNKDGGEVETFKKETSKFTEKYPEAVEFLRKFIFIK